MAAEISVKITVMSELGRYLGWTERSLLTKNKTVGQVLAEIGEHDVKFKDKVYKPASTGYHEELVILLDGINIRQKNGVETPVPDNSEIAIFYPFGGG